MPNFWSTISFGLIESSPLDAFQASDDAALEALAESEAEDEESGWESLKRNRGHAWNDWRAYREQNSRSFDGVLDFLERHNIEVDEQSRKLPVNKRAVTNDTSFDVTEHVSQLEGMNPSERDRAWRRALDTLEKDGTFAELRARGVDIPDAIESYESYQGYLESAGIEFTDRIDRITTGLEVASNNLHMERLDPQRPLFVVVGPKTDHNGAFTAAEGFPLLDTLANQAEDKRVNVIYLEAGSDKEAMKRLMTVYKRTGRRIDTIVFAGHGDRTHMSFGGYDPRFREEDRIYSEKLDMDNQDFIDGDFAALPKILAEDGQVLMWSCSNGADLPEMSLPPILHDNLAQKMSKQVPGRRILATKIPSNIRRLSLDENGRLSVTWWGSDENPNVDQPVILVHRGHEDDVREG